MKTLKLEFTSNRQNYDQVKEMVKPLMSYLDINETKAEDVRCAIAEALANATIYAYPKGEGKVFLEMKITPKNILEVKVRDKGIGIDDIPKAMEAFYTTGADEECTGLGFTVMWAFSDKLKVNSEPGKGTIVKMKFNL